MTSIVPLLTWLFLPLIAIGLSLRVMRASSCWRELIEPNAALSALLAVALYVLLSAIWAADPREALDSGALFSTVVVITFAANRGVAKLDGHQLQRAALASAAGIFIGTLFLTFEFVTHFAATRLAMNMIPLLQRAPRHVQLSHGEVTWIRPAELKHNAAILTFGLWPGLLALSTVASSTRRTILMALFFFAVASCAVLAEHRSSVVALVISLLVFVLAWKWRKPVIRALAVLYCLAFLLVLPADFLVYKTDLQVANWLPSSFRARVIIWEYTAERVLDHPWLGIGAGSTPALREPKETSEKPPGYVFPLNTGRHAHSLFLQTWYELGAVGAILIGLAGVVVILRISRLPAGALPFAAAFFAAFMSIAASSWGMWQTWLVFAVGLSTVYLKTATDAAQQQEPAAQSVIDTPDSGKGTFALPRML
ncbi:MAG: O-antigen ligase family protein [Terriglobales bacterium]